MRKIVLNFCLILIVGVFCCCDNEGVPQSHNGTSFNSKVSPQSNIEAFSSLEESLRSSSETFEYSQMPELQYNLDNWLGDYEYAHNPGEISVLGYMLTIYKEQDIYYGHLCVEGRMFDFQSRTIIQGTENRISVIFDTYLDSEDNVIAADSIPQTWWGPGWSDLKKGDILFELEGRSSEGYTALLTHWFNFPLPDSRAFEKEMAAE